jgi:hypothetical protein
VKIILQGSDFKGQRELTVSEGTRQVSIDGWFYKIADGEFIGLVQIKVTE